MLNADKLTQTEAEIAVSLLDKLKEGDYSAIEDLFSADYEEIPVNINQFIEDTAYFGNVTERGKNIYPYWRDKLDEIFNSDNYYREIILTGPIGTGKTTIAVLAISYCFYRLLCLRNPQAFYDLMLSAPIFFVFFSLTLEFVQDSSYAQLMEGFLKSPWFLERGEIRGRQYKHMEFLHKNIHVALGSKFVLGDGMTGKNVISGCFAGEEKVLTTKGLISYEEASMLPFIEVYCYNKRSKKIKKEVAEVILTKEEDAIYEIELNNGDTIRATMDQKFLIKAPRGKRVMKQLRDIDIEKDEIILIQE